MIIGSLSCRGQSAALSHNWQRISRADQLAIAAMAALCAAGCSPREPAPPTPAAPVTTTAVSGGTLVVPANLPAEQQAQIRAQEQATLDYNRQHAMPPPSGK